MKACLSCGMPNIPPLTAPTVSAMEFTASQQTVRLRDGTQAQLNRPLFSSLATPFGGKWSFSFVLNGTQHNVKGKRRPVEVANEVIQIYTANGKPLSTADLWLNLNLFWFDKVDPSMWLLSKEALLAATLPASPDQIAMATVTPPAVWGSRAWNYMALYLAGNSYDKHTFLSILSQVLDLLNPQVNPSIGCNVCYLEFSKQLEQLRHDPPENRQAAREWLWAFHNFVNQKLGKAIIPYQQAATLNHWNA